MADRKPTRSPSSPDSDAGLSVLNPNPQLLEGSCLLHELIAGPEQDLNAAVEHLYGNGSKETLSYAELHERVAAVSAHLQQYTKTPASRHIIPVFLPQCPWLYVSILGIMKAGAAFCPLNLDVPEERLKFILSDIDAPAIITLDEFRDKLSAMQDLPVITVDQLPHFPSRHQPGTARLVTAQDPAYIMYTSGSTGLPKAVCISHKAATQALLAHDRHVPTFARFLQFASPTFDVSVFEIFFPLFRGCTIISCERSRLLADVPAAISEMSVDAAELTPSVAASLVRRRSNVPTLKLLLTIGEMLKVQVVQEFGHSSTQKGMLYGMYGPTEATIHCTVQPQFGTDLAVNTIGLPLDTVSCFIVKPVDPATPAPDVEVLPLGEVGELAVGGHQLADGYLNREEQTQAAFVHHAKYGRLYRTGDKAKMLHNGLLECLGRISSGQVKLRGQRVELGEIEHAASQVSGCHAAVASVVTGTLVLFCIVDVDIITTQDIRDACRKWLPKFMLPGDIVLLEDFPYLPSGKVDKRRLDSDYEEKAAEIIDPGEPLSVKGKELLKLMHSVLTVDLQPDTNLNAAGLDSLKAIHLASALRLNGYPWVAAVDLLDAKSFRELESMLDASAANKSSSDEVSVAPEWANELKNAVLRDLSGAGLDKDVDDVFSCTPLQDAMLSETSKDPQAYCNSFTLSVDAKYDASKLRTAIESLAYRHQALRSGFCLADIGRSSYCQVVWNSLSSLQISETTAFDLHFSIDTAEGLLRPLHIQIKPGLQRSKVMFKLHHALYDQWSIEILIQDLAAILEGGELGDGPNFRAVADVSTGLSDRDTAADFWQDYMMNASPSHLPSLVGRKVSTDTSEAVVRKWEMDMSTLRSAARRQGCSAHVFFQAAYAYLLGMIAGSDEIMFGTVFSGRTLPVLDVDKIVGPMLSTLPSRVNLRTAKTFGDVLRALHGANRDIMRHGSVSLAEVRKFCEVSPGEMLFDSIFVWQETGRQPSKGEQLIQLLDTRDFLEFNLTLELTPTESGMTAKATFRPSVITADQTVMLLDQLFCLVANTMENTDRLVEEMSDDLDPGLLSIANAHPHIRTFDAGLGSAVEAHATRTPDKPAVTFATTFEDEGAIVETLSYSELNMRANELAHYLLSLGTKPNELVCIMMEKSLNLYIAILATIKAGAAYLPLVPETPVERVRQIFTDACVNTCLGDAAGVNLVTGLDLCRAVDVCSLSKDTFPTSNPNIAFHLSNLAYAVFTSGTTGKPKGVLVTNENLLSHLEALCNLYPAPEGSHLLQACNQAFDVSVFEIFFAWRSGICLCSATKDVLFRDLELAIRALEITHLSLTPTVAALVEPANVPSVRFLVTAGEAVTHHLHQSWAGRGLYNGYGPSEVTNICTVNPAVSPDHAINNIGRALENTSAFVLSQTQGFHPIPVGGLGELCFGGQQVFSGYQNLPDLTASKVIDHWQYGRIYRTGDLGRLLYDGSILIEGRTDDQRKIRGQRIELGEVISCMLQSSSVHDCTVQILGTTKEQEQLVAFWIPTSSHVHEYSILSPDVSLKDSSQHIFRELEDMLPAYMIPSALIPISALPETHQGKVDRRRLGRDFQKLDMQYRGAFSRSADDEAIEEPTMLPTEQQLAAILAETLHVSCSLIRRGTSFFSLGLDSVSAIRFSKRIRTTFGCQIDVSTILKRPSVARLAGIIDDNSGKELKAKSPDHDRHSIDKSLTNVDVATLVSNIEAGGKRVECVLPCTPLQEAMLSASSHSDSSAYMNRTVFEMKCEASKMKHCWEVMLGRHDILRTAFHATEDPQHPFVQVVLEDFDLQWHVFERRDQFELSNLESVTTISLEDLKPPWSLTLYLSESVTHLSLSMHHALYDGNAMSLLLEEVQDVYHGLDLSEPISFTPFLEYMQSTRNDEAEDFFKKHLQGFTPKPFSISAEQDHAGTSRGGKFGVQILQLPFPLTDVEAYLKTHSSSLLALCQAAWSKALSLAQGYTDICFGNVVSGRSVPVDGVDQLVAPCFNTLPLRLDLEGARNNIALVKTLQNLNAQILPHQLFPLRHIQSHMSPYGHRLFDSLVLLQPQPRPLDGGIWTLVEETGEMDFPCIVEITPRNDTLQLSLHFNRSCFTDAAASALCDAFSASFVSCVRYPSSDVSDFMNFDKSKAAKLLAPSETAMKQSRTNTDQASERSAGGQWTPAELEIREAFCALSRLPAEQISRQTTIYRMGLDSISAIQIASRLRKKGFTVDAGDIMEHPSCSALASVAESRTQTSRESTPAFDFEAFSMQHYQTILQLSQARPSMIESVRPCTPVQSGMLSQFIHTQGSQYFNHMFFELPEAISLLRLQEAWRKVVRAHEMLRAGFVELDDSRYPFAMVFYSSAECDLDWMSMEESPDDFGGPQALQETSTTSVLQSLSRPVWRFRICSLKKKRCMQLSAHHAIYDAETLQMILEDLYRAVSERGPNLRQGVDSAISHILSADSHDNDKFWATELRGVAATKFPNLNPVYSERRQNLSVGRVLAFSRTELERQCQSSEVSVLAAGQASWAKILSAYTGESSVCFGVVFSGRTTAATSESAFPCINTLPVACNTVEEPKARLEKLMMLNTALQRHQFTPLTDIQRISGHANEALFDTIFAYQKPASGKSSASSWQLVHEEATVDYAVSVELETLPEDHIGFRLTFDSGVLPSAQATTMLRQLERVLWQTVSGSELAGKDSDNSDESILSILPANEPVLASNIRLLHEFVEQSARQHPDKIALEFVTGLEGADVASNCWTYRQLDEEGNRIAHMLREHGAAPGDVVATSFDKCPEASFAFLGILKAGCAYLAIDPSAPTARKTFILQDSGARLMLTTEVILSELSEQHGVKVLDVHEAQVGTLPTSGLEPFDQNPSSVCYVLYTSGTTGTPKGCEITHENSVQAMLAFQQLFRDRYTSESRWLQFASYHFDVAVVEHFWTWSVGVRLVAASRDLLLEDITAFIDTLQITHLDLTPSLGRLLDPSRVPSLHSGVFITGGEAVKQETIEKWAATGCLFNFYGPTECTIGVTTFPGVPKNGKASNIGWQFSNVGSYVLAPGSQTPVLRGGVGELCISGKLVGKGYFNRRELTAERFPYLEHFNERIYRTGDLVRLLHDGSFDFLGRADSQVKLRGQRLEIDEIDAVIRDCPEVKDVICLVAKKGDKEQLVSFLATSSNRKQSPPELYPAQESTALIAVARSACEKHLPGYMVPTHYIPVKCMPLSANNKVDEKQLKELYASMSSGQIQGYASQSETQRPLDTTEQAVARVFTSIFNTPLEDVQAGSNMFSLGLSSITAIQLSRRLQSAGFPNARVAAIMQNSTIGRLAKVLKSASDNEAAGVTAAKQSIAACRQMNMGLATRVLSCRPDAIEAIAPCTPLQQGIISRSITSDTALYFNSFRYRIRDVNVAKLRDGFQRLVNLHQILRLVFLETENGHVQVVKRATTVPWHELEATSEDGIHQILAKRKAKWSGLNSTHIAVPFELVIVPSQESLVLQVHIHHALYDGNSWELLTQDLESWLSTGEVSSPRTSFLEALPYGPLLTTDVAQEFWYGQLANASFHHIRPLSAEPAVKDTMISTTLDGLQSLDESRKVLKVTLQAVVQACWSATLYKYHRGPIGMIVSGRSIDLDGADAIIGPLFNTVPFSPTIVPKDTWTSVVARCHDFNIATLPFQHTPLRDITKWCRKSAFEPLFETLFAFQQLPAARSQTRTILEPLDDEVFIADYPLAFEAELVSGDKLKITVTAQNAICGPVQASKLVSEFEQALRQLISDPSTIIGNEVADEGNIEELGSQNNKLADLNGITDFDWGPDAMLLRKEIATLANAEESEIDEHSSIFETGLDSIDAVKLSARLKKQGLSVAVSSIMKAQTIPRILAMSTKRAPTEVKRPQASLLAKTEDQLKACFKGRDINIESYERTLPASPMQEALVAEMIKSSYQAYFNHDILRLGSDTDEAQLEQAWQTVINACPILRTTFLEVDDPELESTFAQAILKPGRFEFTRMEMIDGQGLENCLHSITESVRSTRHPACPLRLTLAVNGVDRYLILSIAHALYDGHSLGLLHNDVRDAYDGHFSARPSYDDVIKNALLAYTDAAGGFWKDFLSGATRTKLAIRKASDEPTTTFRKEKASSTSAQELSNFCRKQGVTAQALGQVAWCLVLSYYAQSLDVLFGVVLAGRDTEGAEDVMFPTMNTVLMRSIIHGTRQDMLRYTQSSIADVMRYQQTPLRKIQAVSQLARNAARPEMDSTALFDTLFTFQKRSDRKTDTSAPLYESIQGASDVEYPVAIEIEMMGVDVVWRTACKSNMFSEEATKTLLERVDTVLQAIISSPTSPCAAFTSEGISVCDLPPFKQSGQDGNGAGPPGQSDAAPESEDDAWSEVELQVRDIIAKVTKTPEQEISRTMKLENLGVDSINAIKICSLLRARSIKISVTEIVQAGSVVRIAAKATDSDGQAQKSQGNRPDQVIAALIGKKGYTARHLSLSEATVEKILPATAGQVYMLSSWQNTKGRLFYPVFEYLLTGVADLDKVKASWVKAVARHDILRTHFVATKDSEVPFLQVVSRPLVDIVNVDDRQPFAHLTAECKGDAIVLRLKIHHALYDAVSLSLIIRELEHALASEDTPTQSDAGLEYIALSLGTQAIRGRREFWTQYLQGASRLSRTTPQHARGKRVEVFSPKVILLGKQSERSLRKQGISLQALFFAAYGKAFASITSGDSGSSSGDTVIGVYLANRSHLPDLSSYAGPTVNLVPLRIRAPVHNSLLAVARQVQDDLRMIGTAENSAVGLWEVEQWTGVMIDTFVNFLKLPDLADGNEQVHSDIRIEEVDDGRRTLERRLVHEEKGLLFVEPDELKENLVKDAYISSLDIEATAANGSLAIGLFGWEEMVGLEQADRLMADMKKSMESVLEE